MFTRRSLFGLGIGAAATAVVPHNAAAAEREFVFKREVMVGLDFGKNPAAIRCDRCIELIGARGI